ncbi:MAG: hypothetical protein ACXQT4_01595 [Methanotrichaceae archaeon]
MKLKYVVYILFIATVPFLTAGCITQDQGSGATIIVPVDNLPEGFNFITVLNDSTVGVNMSDEIAKFRGDEDIGDVKATVGVYQWSPMGTGYDSKITVLECEDEEDALVAINNYKNQSDFKKPPFRGVDRFSTAFVNSHEVTEIKDKARKQIKYIYIWNNENKVILVEGNSDRASSLELASVTGL